MRQDENMPITYVALMIIADSFARERWICRCAITPPPPSKRENSRRFQTNMISVEREREREKKFLISRRSCSTLLLFFSYIVDRSSASDSMRGAVKA